MDDDNDDGDEEDDDDDEDEEDDVDNEGGLARTKEGEETSVDRATRRR